jgi:hypothetical protein
VEADVNPPIDAIASPRIADDVAKLVDTRLEDDMYLVLVIYEEVRLVPATADIRLLCIVIVTAVFSGVAELDSVSVPSTTLVLLVPCPMVLTIGVSHGVKLTKLIDGYTDTLVIGKAEIDVGNTVCDAGHVVV